jgi:hypothetical protein
VRALLVVTIACATTARAEPLTLPAGDVALRLVMEGSIDRRTPLRPLSFAPDVWFGATDRLTVGLIHSSQSVDRIAAGATFCVRELAGACDGPYRGSGLDARYAITPEVAPRVRFLVRDIDPAKPALALGALMRWSHRRYELVTDPYLRIGLGNRGLGNRDALVVPVWLGANVAGGRFAIHTGIDGDLAVWRDGWHIPLGVLFEGHPIPSLTIGVEVGYPSLLGPQNTIKYGAMMLYAEWRVR